MKKISILLFLLLIPLSIADPLDAQSLKLNVGLSNLIEIQQLSPNYRVDKLEASLSWIPRDDYRQTVIAITTEPESEQERDELHFEWIGPKKKDLRIRLNAVVDTTSDYLPVKTKVKYPAEEFDSELQQYLLEQDIIDFSPEILEKALELSIGKDDQYEIVLAIADWTNTNIEYSLDSLTADASQKSTWVLKNRRGVCDELTSLFISMLRSIGIPARFVYGQSFTNNGAYDDGWGGHGWAEVYFPGYGWVPFDTTYGEYGYVSAGHVKMGVSKDARKPSVKYSSLGHNINVRSGFLDIDSKIITEGTKSRTGLQMKLETYYPNIGSESHNLITTTVKNTDNFYKPVVLRLIKPKEVTSQEPDIKTILLKPEEEKKVYWIVKLGKLDSGFVYTYPIKVITDKHHEESVQFKGDAKSSTYPKDALEALVKNENEAEEKPYSKNIDVKCKTNRQKKDGTSYYYVNDNANFTCSFNNTGEKSIKASLCFENECEDLQLSAKESHQKQFSHKLTKPGIKNLIVTLDSRELSKTAFTRANVIDESDIDLKINTTEEANYDQIMQFMFSLEKKSTSIPKNVRIELEFQNSVKFWELELLDRPSNYNVNINTNSFTFDNDFTIRVQYEDELGKKYNIERSHTVKIVDMNIKEWTIIFLNTLGHKIITWFS